MNSKQTPSIEFTDQSFQRHLIKDHKMDFFSENLKDIVYGGTDGIVTTFTVVAGFTGASLGNSGHIELSIIMVLLFGLTNLFADGASMGLGNYISLRAEHRKYKAYEEKERYEIETNTVHEKAETLYLLKKRGFSEDDAEKMAVILMQYPDFWLDFMMKEELGLENTTDQNPAINGLVTFLSFCMFGIIPLLPYIAQLGNAKNTFYFSALSTLLALVILGLISAWLSKRNRLFAILETVSLGSVAAVIAYFVGSLFA